MTIPIEVRLATTDDGPRMTFTPVKELESLRTTSHRIPIAVLNPTDPNPLAVASSELVEIRADFEPGTETNVAFRVRGVDVVWEAKTQEIVVNGHRAPAPLRDGRQQLVIYCDRTGLEVFASDGLCYVPMPLNVNSEDRSSSVKATGGAVRFRSLEIHELGSAWSSLTNSK
jgi:sucrose-6-phosphate hydrolase SacC (GH32 family)